MEHPQYPLLETYYDDEHRGHELADLEPPPALVPLRARTHVPLQWDPVTCRTCSVLASWS